MPTVPLRGGQGLQRRLFAAPLHGHPAALHSASPPAGHINSPLSHEPLAPPLRPRSVCICVCVCVHEAKGETQSRLGRPPAMDPLNTHTQKTHTAALAREHTHTHEKTHKHLLPFTFQTHINTHTHTSQDGYDTECVLRCEKKDTQRKTGSDLTEKRRSRRRGKKKIIPTTVPFISELEQCASNQKA